MPKGIEERRKSETKSSGSSEALASKPERRISVESAAASTLEDKDRKESISSAQLDCSSLSVDSIVTEETEKKSDVKPVKIQKSDTTESQLLVSGLQPPASEKTRVSPVKEFFSNLAQKLHLSTPQKKSPTKTSPEIEEYVPGQELKRECIVKLPPKDKKTQTVKLSEARNITPQKRAASFLSPETCEDNETSASQSTTGDERDLITPSPTPRLDASKMTLAITGFEPVKPEPGPFQKFRKLMGFEKEDKPLSDQTSIKSEHATKAESTQTINMPMSAILTESVLVLKEQDRGWVSEISTSDSVDYPEWSQGTSENSMDCSSSMNADTSSSSPPKSPMEVGAVASSLTGSEKSLQLKFERTNIVEKPVIKKMPNPIIEMLKHEKSEHIEDEATSTSPRKKDSEDCFSEPPPSFHKEETVSETFSTETRNVTETEEASGTITESTVRGVLSPISKSSDEGMNVEESTETNIVAESNVKDILVPSSKSLSKVTKFEDMFQEESESCSTISQSDIKALSVSDGRCKDNNVQETSEKVKMVLQTDEKDLLISKSQGEKMNVERISKLPETTDAQLENKDVSNSKSQGEEMNVKETSKEAKNIVAQSDKDFSISNSQGKKMNPEEISEEDKSTVTQLEKREVSISKDQEDKMEVIDTSEESESIAPQSNKIDLYFPNIQDKDIKVEEISKETDAMVSEPDKKDLSMKVEDNLKESTDAAARISEPNLISFSTLKGLDIDKSSKEAYDNVSKPDEKDLSITSSSKEMNVEDVSKEVESRIAESDKENLSIQEMNDEENSQVSSDATNVIAQPTSLFSISEGSVEEENVKTTSQEASEPCGSVSKAIEHDYLLSKSHNKGMNVDNLSEEASNMVCKTEEKDFSVPNNEGEETTEKESSKEYHEAACKVPQLTVLFSTSKCLEEIKANETFKEDGEAAGKVVSSILTSLDEEMEIEGSAKELSDKATTLHSTSTSQRKEMLVEDISKEASETTGKVAQLITLFSSSTNPGEELNVLETSTKTSEDNGRDAQSDNSISTSKDEEMNVEIAMQENSKTCTKVDEADIKDLSAVSTSLDDEQMDTS